MEEIKCNTEVAMETIGEARNSETKSKMAESWFEDQNGMKDQKHVKKERTQYSATYTEQA